MLSNLRPSSLYSRFFFFKVKHVSPFIRDKVALYGKNAKETF